jgi:zinc metalloprotease ZmpB
MLLTAGLALIASAVLVTVAVAAKPGPGSSTGRAAVFVSNPVEDLGDQSLRDQKDSAAAVPAAAYHTVTLTDLDGSGFLRGRGRRSSARRATRHTRRPTPSSTTEARTSSSR